VATALIAVRPKKKPRRSGAEKRLLSPGWFT
jgi:hypothetical protein